MTIKPSQIESWIVRDPYPGNAQSFLLPNGTVAYTDGLTFEAYAKTKPFPVRLVTTAELDELTSAHEDSMCTSPTPIDYEQFDYALNVLPPCRWVCLESVEWFHVSERISGSLVNWYLRVGPARDESGKFFEFVDRASIPESRIRDLIKSVS